MTAVDPKSRRKTHVGRKIAAERERLGLSQTQLTERLGLADRRHVSMWETGVHEPSADNLERLAELFGRPGGWWFFVPVENGE